MTAANPRSPPGADPRSTTRQIDRILDGLRRRLRRRARWANRHLLALGNRVRCPVCQWTGSRFAASSKPRRPNRICPNCQSSERYRALELWLRKRGPVRAGARLLEIAPIALVEPTAGALGYRYSSLDLASARARVLGDLCRVPFDDGAFDVVVCFHVLEHIPADHDAMRELGRILAPDGVAIVIVPLDRTAATTFEDPDARPEDRERLYGQSDHVRMYGLDVVARLRLAGLAVDEALWSDVFTTEERTVAALDGDDDRFWICTPGAP